MMALVEVSWEDQFGTRHTSSAKLEDISVSGACLRVKVPVAIGSAMRVNSYRERFSGTARYCRTDRRDFVVGVQKDKIVNRFLTDIVAPKLEAPFPRRNTAIVQVNNGVREGAGEKLHEHEESASENQNPSAIPTGRMKPSIAVMPSRAAVPAVDDDVTAKSALDCDVSKNESRVSPPTARFQFSSPRSENPKGRENMPNKWSDLAPWRQKQTGKESDVSAAAAQATPASGHHGSELTARGEQSKSSSHSASATELTRPPKTPIHAELERITAQHQERIKRNLDEIAREKVIFAIWQTMKQQEAQFIGEAAGICSKPSLDETFEEPQRAPRSLIATAKPA
jgi:hypothetical protein